MVNYRSFNDYESVVYLQHLNGLDVGDRQHGRQATTAMLGCVEAEWREQTKSFLSKPLESTGHLPYIGIAADKVSDNYNGRVPMLRIFRNGGERRRVVHRRMHH